MTNEFDSLSDKQRIAAENYVDNIIAHQKDSKIKKMTQEDLGETVGVTGRTVRNWLNDVTFLSYIQHMSMKRLQVASPAFVGVLIRNLERGDNVSTKQLDLIAKVAGWVPDKGSSGDTYTQINYNGPSEVENRIAQLRQRKEAEVIEVKEEEKEHE